MATSSPDQAGRRLVQIETACRVAMRMVKSGRSGAEALQFLMDVAARRISLPIAIVAAGSIDGERSIVAKKTPLHMQSSTPGVHSRIEDCRSLPIRTQQGETIGELWVRTTGRDKLDAATSKALELIARTAAEIMAASGLNSKNDQSG